MLSLKVSLHISHLSTALKLLLTYSSTPPAPCPSDFWFSRSFLNNLYPSKASSLSAIFGFVHDFVIPIMSDQTNQTPDQTQVTNVGSQVTMVESSHFQVM